MKYDYYVMTEAYVGKTKRLLEAEKYLKIIVDRCNSTSPRDGASYRSINEMREVEIVENLLKKEFGFKKVILNFYETRSEISLPNACTFPLSFKIETEGSRKKSNMEKFMNPDIDRSSMTACVNVGVELIRLMDLNEGELLAIILHELGHNDDFSMYYKMARISAPLMRLMAGDVSALVTLLPIGEPITKFLKELNTTLAKIGWLNKLTNTLFRIGLTLNALSRFVDFLLIPVVNPITMIPAAVAVNMSLVSGKAAGYKMEEYADSFATKYGYGPELASALHKFDSVPDVKFIKKFDKTPKFMQVLMDLSALNFTIVTHMIDEHPQTITRITNQMRVIEEELNTNTHINPKLKKELQADYDDLKKFVETEVINENHDVNKTRKLRALYCGFVYRLSGGKTDARDFIPAVTAMNKESYDLLVEINNFKI